MPKHHCEETWQSVADGYQVSTKARVLTPLGKYARPTMCRKTGRAMITIKRNGKFSVEELAAIVAEAFLGRSHAAYIEFISTATGRIVN